MKKVALTLASVLAAATFAQEASAVPAFARQTGMACSACHFQSYPVLNSFGKSFKVAGYTMVGGQPLIEGEHGMSLPSTLNAGVYMQARYNKNGAKGSGAAPKGQIDLPDEFALFMGGRVNEHTGVLLEYNLKDGGMANLKFPMMFDMGDMKVGVVPFNSDGLGPQYAFDLFATGSTANGRVIENGDSGYSAGMYLGTNHAASGAALVVANDMFHVALTPYAGDRAHKVTATTLGATYLRVGFTPSIAGWDLGIGLQNFSGDALKGASIGAGPDLGGTSKEAATLIDAQAQGEFGGMPVGVYSSYGRAAASPTGTATPNRYNSGTSLRSALGALVEVGVIPETLMLDVGFMTAKTGTLSTAGRNETDNSFTVGAKYKLTQNQKLGFAYTTNSGSAHDAGGSGGMRGKNRLSAVFSFGY